MLSLQVFQLFNAGNQLTSDIQFNDLYYKKHGLTTSESYMDKEKKVILANIQEFPFDNEGRERYVLLLNKLVSYKTAAIGVDVTFKKEKKDVFLPFKNNPKIIFANRYSSADLSFINNGDTRFPKIDDNEQRSLRYYKNDKNSFGAQLANAAFPKFSVQLNNKENFLIHYNSIHSGLCHLMDDENQFYGKNYKFLNASEIIADSSNVYADYYKNKIVIVGYLGDRKHANAAYDVEDKKRVPVDINNFVDRDPLMFGAVIHANAISTILDKELHFYDVGHGTILVINLFISALFMYILLFVNLSKLWDRVILIFLTIFSFYAILYLMDFGIYYHLGGTLLALLIMEETYEIIEPYEQKFLSKHLKK